MTLDFTTEPPGSGLCNLVHALPSHYERMARPFTKMYTVVSNSGTVISRFRSLHVSVMFPQSTFLAGTVENSLDLSSIGETVLLRLSRSYDTEVNYLQRYACARRLLPSYHRLLWLHIPRLGLCSQVRNVKSGLRTCHCRRSIHIIAVEALLRHWAENI